MNIMVERLDQYTSAQYEAARRLLPEERRQRIDRIATIDDRRRSVLAEQLARRMLESCTGTPPWDIPIAYGVHGKPHTPGVCFSISHSGNFIACVTDEHSVGIDIEVIREMDIRLASACCTQAEQDSLAALPPCDRSRYLLRLWVLKEATIKCMGQDLLQMPRYEFTFPSTCQAVCSDASLAHTLYECSEGYVLAVCRQIPTSIKSNESVEKG